jgi:hypothetical protein
VDPEEEERWIRRKRRAKACIVMDADDPVSNEQENQIESDKNVAKESNPCLE